MPEIHFDRYYRYDDITRLLHAYAEEYPQLVKVSSIGKSHEGREIWLATVTNFATGEAEAKPALWVDGNIHASEVSPSSACLYLLNALTTKYGQEADVTRCLDSRAFYIAPRINPDGAEWALADKPKIIRSGTRPYPFDEEPLDGLEEQDIDGDGRMLQMRLVDPHGPWKAHPDDPRLMIRRDPTEVGGTYYRILPEGLLKDYDGITIKPMPSKQGLDFNRNFPAHWRQEGEQRGAGPYPTSEPEIRAMVDFIANHLNITGAIAYHTWSGVLLRPSGTQPDDTLPAEDLWTFQHIGKKGTDLTGYPAISNFHDFKYHPKEVITGTFDDWAYDHYGLYAWVVELWSPQRQAGIKDYKFIDWYREHDVADDLLLLKWNDEKLGGQGYVNWYEFDHPQLGKIELGGWNMQYAWRNPPPQFLEAEIAPFADWALWHLLISPRLEVFKSEVTPLGGDNYKITLALQNTGWLPSYVSKKSLERKVIRGVICEVELPKDAALRSGKLREEFGQLEGRAYTGSSATPWAIFRSGGTADRLKVEYIIHAPQGGTVNITARSDRAGTVKVALELK
ncbi:MAG: M14 family metallopeptidase [Anaerolineae bacterium]